MIALLLIASALAQPVPTIAESETIAQLRHDLLGERLLPIYEYIRFDSQTGNTQFVGYAALETLIEPEPPADVDLYALYARRKVADGEWVLGRQQATTLLRRQTFDGGRFWWRPTGRFALEAWGGVARHQGLDDLLDGTGIARISANYGQGPLLVRGGVQLEAGPETSFIARQDLQARLMLGGGNPTVVEGLLSVAEPGFVPEWARLEVRTPRVWITDFTVHAQHREVADPRSLFGDAILQDLVGGPVDEVGVGIRAHGARWARLSATARLLAYDLAGSDEPSLGQAIDLQYVQPLGAPVRLTPRYTFRTGPGGVYHALYAMTDTDLSDRARVRGWGAVAPYRKHDDPWGWTTAVGAEGEYAITGGTSLRLFGEVASDVVFKIDTRIGAALTVALR